MRLFDTDFAALLWIGAGAGAAGRNIHKKIERKKG